MLSARRFFRSSLSYLPGYSFGESNKPNTKSFNEYIKILEEQTSERIEKRTDKVVDENTLEMIKAKAGVKKSKIVLDSDHYRVDVGLMIDRNPIFIYGDDNEIEQAKLRHKMMKKYKLYFPITKDLMDFRERVYRIAPVGAETLLTHMKTNPDGTFDRYYAFSKEFQRTDPEIADRRSIQYASCHRVYLLVKHKGSEKWAFPTTAMVNGLSFYQNKLYCFQQLSNTKWKIYYPTPRPLCLTERKLSEEEKTDPTNRKAVGVRTYYFQGSHDRGKVLLNKELYEDSIWVSRLELSQFLDKEEYSKYVYSMLLY